MNHPLCCKGKLVLSCGDLLIQTSLAFLRLGWTCYKSLSQAPVFAARETCSKSKVRASREKLWPYCVVAAEELKAL